MIEQGKSRRILLLATFIFLSFLYFVTSTRISVSNEGSHYALVKSLVDKRSPELGENVAYTRWVDYAVKDGKTYSDRLPGTALVAAPFYACSKIITMLGISRRQYLGEVTVALLPNLCVLASIVALFMFLANLGVTFKNNYLACLFFGISTLCWHEASHLFSHAASIFFVFVPVVMFVSIRDIYVDKVKALLAVAMLSYSMVVELQNILVFLPVAVYLLLAGKIVLSREHLARNARFLVFSSALSLVAAGILLGYNYWAFHEITFKSNKYNPNFPEELSFLSSLSGNFWKGLDLLFTNFGNPVVYCNFAEGRDNSTPGLFVSTPILLLSAIGFVWMFREMKKEAFLFVAIIVMNVVIAALHKTTLTRHVSTVIPFLFVPVVFLFKRIDASKSTISRTLSWVVVVAAALAGTARVLYVTLTYYERILLAPFEYVHYWWIYLAFYACLGLFLWCLYLAWRSRKQRA